MKPNPTLRSFLAAIGSATLVISSACAADLFWSANGTSQGGAGTWDTTNTRWGTVAAGPYGTTWDNVTNANDTAIFGSTAGAISLGTDITAGGLTFNTTGYSISAGNTLTLAGASTPIINVVTSGHTATISSIIAGTNGLQKDGAGTLAISTAPTYTGATTITGGTFNVSGIAGGASPVSLLSNTSGIAFTTADSTFRAAAGGTATVTYPAMSISGVSVTFDKGTSGNNTPYAIPSLTGSGTFTFSNSGNTGTGTSVTVNTLTGFTGNLQLNMSNSGGGGSINAPNLDDSVGSKILINAGSASTPTAFNFTGSSSLILDNRQFELNGTFANGLHVINNNGTSSSNFTINSNLAVTGANAKVLRLGGSNAGGTSTFAGNIVDGSGIVSLIKADASTWVLSGTNTYTGGTTVTGGTLRISNAAALPSSGNLIVTGGTIESTVGTITAARYVVSAGTFTAPLGGAGDLYKSGTGTVTLNGVNSYSGGTIVAGGTLAVGASGTLGANTVDNSISIENDGVLRLSAAANSGSNQGITLSSSLNTGVPVIPVGAGPVGRLAVLALGFNGLPNGAISQANTLGGVIAINAVTGYNTDLSTVLTGKNLFLGAIGTSTFTGAAGTVVAGNDSLYRLGGGGGTLTFNTTNLFTGGSGVHVGSTFVNGGGTVVVSAAQDYTGATTVNAGTLTLSGADGAATGSSGFTLNGGRLFLDSSGAVGNNNANRIGDVDVSLRNGGDLHLNGNAAGTTEAFGNLVIGSGYSIVTAAATTTASTLAGAEFARTNNGTALFRGTALGTNVAAMGQVTLSDTTGLSFVGASTLNNAASGDTTKDVKIVPYLIGGITGTDTGTTFVTYDDTLGFRALNITNQFNTTVTAGTNVRFTAAQTGIATNSINSLVVAQAGPHTIADGATLTVASGAVLFSAAGTIAPVGSGTGILAFGAAEGIVTTVANGTISASITGSGGLTKSGTGQLTLSNANNSYTGGTVINGGTLATSADGHLGGSGGITVNGNATWSMGGSVTSYARDLTINEGATLQLTSGNAGKTVSGVFSGNGTLFANHFTDFIFSNSANTFTGAIVSHTANNLAYGLGFASIGDTAGAGLINLVGNQGTFRWLSASGSTTTLVNRQFSISTPGQATISALGTTAASNLVINKDLLVTGEAGARSLRLAGTNTGNNTFAGKITDGPGSVVTLVKADAGTWFSTNTANSYTGGTTVSAGTLGFANGALGSSGTINASGGTLLWNTGNTQDISSRLAMTAGTTTTLNTNGNDVTFANAIGSSTTGALTKAGAGTLLLNGTNTYTGLTTVNDGALGGTGTIGGAVTVNAAGSLAPGASAGTLAINGALTLTNQLNGGTGKLKFELGSIASSDKITVGGNLTIGTAFLDFSDFEFSTLSGLQDGTYTLLTYTGTLSGSIAGSGLSGVINGVGGSGNATLNLNTGTKTLELVVTETGAANAYDTWATAKGLTGAPGSSTDPAKAADPDGDGRNNLYEFAFDGNPLSGANDGKIVGKVATVGGNQVMTLTLPVRTGTTFSPSSGDQLSALIDGIYYRVEGDVNLSTFANTITEVIGGDATTIQTGLPVLSTGWTYRTFRDSGTVSTVPKTFLRAKVSETP